MSERLTLKQLLRKYHPALARAFLAATRDIVSRVQLKQIVEALDRGDIQATVDAMYLDRAAYAEFEALIGQSFADGGSGTVEGLGGVRDGAGNRFVFRFDARNLRAEQILQEQSAGLVVGIVEEQRQSVRQALTEGMARGDNPRTVALDIVGRKGRTGRRTGGIIGLAPGQVAAVVRARQELKQGDFAAYRQRAKRDRRFDQTLAKVEREGRSLTKAEIERIAGRYSDRLLKLRGDTIGRTEALRSLNTAAYEALSQLVETGKILPGQIRRTWDSAGDRRVRFSHAVMDGEAVGFGEAFTTPRGRRMMHPGDPAGGAEETINCRCVVNTRIDYRPNR